MEKHLVTLELRYNDSPKYGDDHRQCISKTITIGVYDDFQEACDDGNAMLELLETRYPFHVFPDGTSRKERFSLRGGCFGSKKALITNLAYLKTPFDFYAKIDTLKYGNVVTSCVEAAAATKRYRDYLINLDD